MKNTEIEILEKGASTEIKKETLNLSINHIQQWLISKSIINSNDKLNYFKDVMPWIRTGAETYCSSFLISTKYTLKQIVIKALVTLSPSKSLQDWARRRKIFSMNKIPVSNWYYYSDALIIEDYYPNTANVVSFKKILSIGYKIDKLGFTTLNFVNDIRADCTGEPYYIDFGFDLGDPSETPKNSAKEYLLKNYPEQHVEIEEFYK